MVLVKLFAHNNWANARILEACAGLSEVELAAEPVSATVGTIGEALSHLFSSQDGYYALLTGAERRFSWETFPGFDELKAAAEYTGEGLLALARGEHVGAPSGRLRTRNGYLTEPWVVMVQVINHATEHREQIKSMLSALGVEPPDIDSWSYGLETGDLVPPEA